MKFTRSLATLIAGVAFCAAACAGTVEVRTAWYGESCGAIPGNVTAHVQTQCAGKDVCQYRVDTYAVGDPAPGCQKNYVVLFTCSGEPDLRLAQIGAEAQGKTITLACRR